MDEISALIKEAVEHFLVLFQLYKDTSSLATQKRAFTKTWPCWHPDLDIDPLKLRNRFWLFISHLVYGILL